MVGAPQVLTYRRAPIRRRLNMAPRNYDALPSTDPVEIPTHASGSGLAQSGGWIPPPRYIFRFDSEVLRSERVRMRRRTMS